MTKPLRKRVVFGITYQMQLPKGPWFQARQIVAARTKAEAAKALGIPYGSFVKYSCETHNDEEVAIALADPGAVFYRTRQWANDGWKRKP